MRSFYTSIRSKRRLLNHAFIFPIICFVVIFIVHYHIRINRLMPEYHSSSVDQFRKKFEEPVATDLQTIKKKVIISTLRKPRKSSDHSLQQLINISKKVFEKCPDDMYSPNFRLLLQSEWKTTNKDTEMYSVDRKPLIFYATSTIYHTINSSGCKYQCDYTFDSKDYDKADLAVYTHHWSEQFSKLDDDKMWAFETMESPVNHFIPTNFPWNKVHIYITYISDSLVPIPYGLFLPFKNPHCLIPQSTRNAMVNENGIEFLPAHHKNRKKLAAWLVTNNKPQLREQKFVNLSSFMQIDRYGAQGIPCGKSGDIKCLEKLSSEYKFILSFENSYCKEYITEKLFRNALGYGLVPIVYGASSDEYFESAPPNSFISVDDFSSDRELAEYIMWLDKNDTAYATYFVWKKYGYITTESRADCRLCGVLHNILNGSLDDQKNQQNRFAIKSEVCNRELDSAANILSFFKKFL